MSDHYIDPQQAALLDRVKDAFPVRPNMFQAMERNAVLEAENLKLRQPVDMLLFCPQCGEQHIDEPQPEKNWDNPPHRSHECQFCQHVWRPADVATNGVLTIQTKGQRDGNARPRYFATAHDYEQAKLEQILGRLRQGEKLLAHACENACGYPCGYVMRGGEFCLDCQCWCTSDLEAAIGGRVKVVEFKEITEWVMSGGFRGLPRLVLYCEDRGTWTPESWAEYIGATPKEGANYEN